MLDAITGTVIHEYLSTDGSLTVEAGHLSAVGGGDGTVRHVYGGDLPGNVWRFDLHVTAPVLSCR